MKQAKLQSRQRSRELKRTIRSVVLETLESFKAQVNRQLKNVRGAVGKNKKCITADLEARLNNVSDDVREHLEEQLGARVQELAEKVEHLTSGLDASNELRIKCEKNMKKMLKTLKVQVTSNQKTLKKSKNKHKRKGKGRGTVVKKENVEAAPPSAPAPAPAAVHVPAIISRPPTPMVPYPSDRTYTVFGSPPVPNRVVAAGSHSAAMSHFAADGQQYVSPAFARRNFAR